MDYSTITSLELFVENEIKIQNDFMDNFKNRENRISIIDCILRINPLPGETLPSVWSNAQLFSALKKYTGILEGTMLVYIANELDWVGMWKDIERTDHFNFYLNEKEQLLLDGRFSVILDEVNGRVAKQQVKLRKEANSNKS